MGSSDTFSNRRNFARMPSCTILAILVRQARVRLAASFLQFRDVVEVL